MISVSTAFQAAIKATVRHLVPRVRIEWTSDSVDATIAVTSNDDNYATRDAQVTDGVTTTPRKWACLDENMIADGTWYPCPSSPDTSQQGWYGATACDSNAEWTTFIPALTVTFEDRSVTALLVSGDSVYNEYPVDFTIKIYGSADTLLHTETVTGNALLVWTKDISASGINNAVKMVLEITKWNVANRVAKITEFYTSIIDIFEGDDIVSMNLLEESEISDGSIPVGNISANEIDIKLQNIDLVKNGVSIRDPFFYKNTGSYLNALVKPKRRVTAWIGLILPDDTIEYVQLGKFWTGDWDASETDATTSVTCRDRMELLKNAEYKESVIATDVTLYDLLTTVLTSAKTNIPMADLEYTIDEELKNYTVAFGYFPRQSYFKCIKQIVEACMGQAYMSKLDVLTVVGPSDAGTTTGYAITKDDYFNHTQPAKSDELYNYVSVPVTAISEQDDSSDVYTSDAIILEAGEEKIIDIEYSSYPSVNVSATLDDPDDDTTLGADIVIVSSTFCSCNATVTIKNNGTSSESCKVVLSGTAYDANSDTVVDKSDAGSIAEYGKIKYDYTANHLIQTSAMAETIAAILLDSYKTWRKDTNIVWRGDPCLELRDLIQVPEYKRFDIDNEGTFKIYKQKTEFEGYYKSTIDGRKVL